MANFSLMSARVASQDHCDRGSLGTALELLDELAAVHARHAIVADQKVGRVIDRLEQRVGGVSGGIDHGQGRERATQHPEDHGIVVHQEDFDVVCHCRG